MKLKFPFYNIHTRFLYFFVHDCNNVLGRERKITSEPIKVEVVGKPQVLPFKANFKQDFPLHSDAVIKASFCSDPKPRNLKWQWGSLLLTGGKLLNHNAFVFCAV